MGNNAPKDWRTARPARRTRMAIDASLAPGGVAVMLIAYIICHFVYPLIAKGILF